MCNERIVFMCVSLRFLVVASVWSSKTLRCFDAMGVVGSQDVKNMRIIISSFKPCTCGVMVHHMQLPQSIF